MPQDGNNPINSDTDVTLSTAPGKLEPIKVVIGAYTLLERIGVGGMGEVWLAEQKEPVRRRVALKLIKAGMDGKDVVARFESERQALALMDHPNIAKVFDGGSTPDGHPYFVMEYVAGMPITAYCDKHKLTTRQRLELFIHVCEGVQHAHQKAIIHRDLKPSNILVSEVDSKPLARIIDFGVAKATAQRLTEHTMYTRVGTIVGTLEYMSPEQADSRGHDVDTRTDVYSLGVVLYELMVGALPLEMQNLAYDQALRLLREKDALCPSTRLRTLGEKSITSAQNRNTDPPALSRQLHGDVDAITLKAVEKDRARRYATPLELAADIERHLNNQPVVARPASRAYRLRKYVRRHRLGVSLAAAAAVLLIAFASIMAVQNVRISRERDRANRITDFMLHIFRVSDPSEARGNSITARELLDKASKEIGTSLAKDPKVQAQMLYTMGNVYEGLGLYKQAESLLSGSAEIRSRVLGPDNPDTLDSMGKLGVVMMREGRTADAEKLERETLDGEHRIFGLDDPRTLASMVYLAEILQDEQRYAEAEKVGGEALERGRRALKPDSHEVFIAAWEMGSLRWDETRDLEAEKFMREAVAIARRTLGDDHPETLQSISLLSNVLLDEGQFAEAEQLQREIIDTKRRVLGPEHPRTLRSMSELGNTLWREGHYADAEKLLRETIAMQQKVEGMEGRSTLLSMLRLGLALSYQGRYSEAEKVQRETLTAQSRVLGADDENTLASMANLGHTLAKEGRYVEGEKLLREALDRQQRVLGPENSDTADTAYELGCIAALQGHADQAFALLTQAVDHGLYVPTDLGIEKDADLKSLHGDPRFTALVVHAKEVAEEKQNAASAATGQKAN